MPWPPAPPGPPYPAAPILPGQVVPGIGRVQLPPRITVTPDGRILSAGPMPLRGLPTLRSYSAAGGVSVLPSVIPLNPVPAQILNVTLGAQATTIKIYGKDIFVPDGPAGTIITGPPAYKPIEAVFMDLLVNDASVLGGALCVDRSLIVRNSYLGFTGDLAFLDTQGLADPRTSGLGTRWLLAFWPALL